MATGHSKYNDTCAEVMAKHRAHFALVIILEGDRGDGFALQWDSSIRSKPNIVKMLRATADNIERRTTEN